MTWSPSHHPFSITGLSLWFTMTSLTSAVQSKSFYNYFYAIERSIILSSKMKISLPLALSMSSASGFDPAASKCTIVLSEHTARCSTKSNKEDLELTHQVIAKFVEDVSSHLMTHIGFNKLEPQWVPHPAHPTQRSTLQYMNSPSFPTSKNFSTMFDILIMSLESGSRNTHGTTTFG